jgi:hypothetical protein
MVEMAAIKIAIEAGSSWFSSFPKNLAAEIALESMLSKHTTSSVSVDGNVFPVLYWRKLYRMHMLNKA